MRSSALTNGDVKVVDSSCGWQYVQWPDGAAGSAPDGDTMLGREVAESGELVVAGAVADKYTNKGAACGMDAAPSKVVAPAVTVAAPGITVGAPGMAVAPGVAVPVHGMAVAAPGMAAAAAPGTAVVPGMAAVASDMMLAVPAVMVVVAAPAVVVVAAPGVAGYGHLLPVVVWFSGG